MNTITPEVYAVLRLYIDTGAAIVLGWLKEMPCGDCEAVLEDQDTGEVFRPTIYDMAKTYYEYVPWESVSLAPAAALVSEMGLQVALPQDTAQGRISWATFADREQLIKALDAATPASVRAQLGSLDRPPSDQETGIKWGGADVDGIGWWAIALSAVGVLAWLGRRTIWGFVISLGAKRLLQLLAGAALAGTVGVAALKFLGSVAKTIEAAGDSVPYVAIGAIGLSFVGLAVWLMKGRRR